MKSIVTGLLIFTCAATAVAQPEKGNIMVGANLANANATFVSGSSNYGVNLNPMAGLFLTRDLAVGASVNVGASFVKSATYLTYGATPFARYFFPTKKRDFTKNRYFAHIQVGYAGYSTINVTPSVNNNALTAGAGVGMAHFITPNVALELSAMYHMNYDFKSTVINHMPGINWGFQVYLPGKHKVEKKPAAKKAKAAEDDDE